MVVGVVLAFLQDRFGGRIWTFFLTNGFSTILVVSYSSILVTTYVFCALIIALFCCHFLSFHFTLFCCHFLSSHFTLFCRVAALVSVFSFSKCWELFYIKPRVYRKYFSTSLRLGVRSVHTLPSPDASCGITLGVLLLALFSVAWNGFIFINVLQQLGLTICSLVYFIVDVEFLQVNFIYNRPL